MLKIFKRSNALLENYLEIIEENKDNKALFSIAFDSSKIDDLFENFPYL